MRVGGQRLSDAHPLQLAARHHADPDIGQVFAVDLSQRLAAPPRAGGPGRRTPAAVTPQRCPSTPSRTRSRPRSITSRSIGRCCGT